MRHGWRCPPLPRRQRACPVLDTGTEVRVLLSRGFRGILVQTVPQQPHLVAEGPDFGTRPGAPTKHIRIEARRIRTEMRLAHGGCERGVHIARIARAFAPVNDRPSFRRSRADGNPSSLRRSREGGNPSPARCAIVTPHPSFPRRREPTPRQDAPSRPPIRRSREGGNPLHGKMRHRDPPSVVPAKAGTHSPARCAIATPHPSFPRRREPTPRQDAPS